MSLYVSTNVRLPRELLKALKLRAVEEGKSMGQVFRELLYHGLRQKLFPAPWVPKPGRRRETPFNAIVGLGESGLTDSASEHDKYLYGESKTLWKG